jgi:amino acid adenylation domain-containing protein
MESVIKQPDDSARFPGNQALASLSAPAGNPALRNSNPPKVDYPRDKCIPEIFAARVQDTPAAVAVVFQDQPLTYRELDERANQLAHHLRTLGVQLETPVGVYMDRSANYVVSVLGILKAGGTYVPLATDYPVDRLQFMLQDAGLPVIVVDQPLPNGLDVRGHSVVDLAQDAPLIQALPKNALDLVCSAESLAYIIYTSGSTGQPKGVAIPHRGVVRLVCGQNYAAFDDRQRFLLLASTSFDASTFELWGPLLNGGRCVVFPNQPLDFHILEIVIRQQGVTCLWLTAGLFNQIIDARPSVLETVQHVLAGGEALSVAHLQKAMARLPNLRLTNGYGPTESTTFACTYALPQGTPLPAGSVPIGRPIAHTRCYLLDPQLRPVPLGAAGELYLGGDGLARGYHNRPALTTEKFMADPFNAEPQARIYKTGDLARYLPDGNLEFLGRRDHQLKIRGFRIEPGEIEAVLTTHPDLLQVAVIAREDVPGHKLLVAYFVNQPASAPTAGALREFLRQKLPAYMIPAGFVRLQELPLTANGKVDRNALQALQNPVQPAPAGGLPTRALAAGSALDTSIALIWQAVLQQPVSGVDGNFFDLGGDSIRMASVHVHLQRLLDRPFPITDLFLHPTIRSLSAHFSRADKPRPTGDAHRSRARRQIQAFSDQRAARQVKTNQAER